jgi:alkylated DNA repair dioxygenase AlkB
MRLRKLKNNNKENHKEIKEIGNYNFMCWIGIDNLDDVLLNYYNDNFIKLWSLHPIEKSTIIMREQNISANRYLQSYLNTPSLEAVNIKKSSYMFSTNNKTELPEEFEKLLNYVNKKFNYNYNQVVVNWYNDGDDYLPYHKDWTNNNSDEFLVTTLSLCEKYGERDFIVKDDEYGDKNEYKFVTTNGLILTIGGMTNTFYKHGIPKQENRKKRISITFRYFEECKDTEKC